MDILKMLNEIEEENYGISFIEHPAVKLDLDKKILYIYGIALIMNTDSKISSKEEGYLKLLVKLLKIDDSYFEQSVDFSKSADKEAINDIIENISETEIIKPFLLDLLLMAYIDNELNDSEIKIFEQFGKFFKINKKTLESIMNISTGIRNKNISIIKKVFADQENGLVQKDFSYILNTVFDTNIAGEVKVSSISAKLSEEYVNTMIKEKNFFDFKINKNGNFKNDYITKIISGKTVIIDRATDLMWHKYGSIEYLNWSKAKKWIENLNKKKLAGYDNWRLPTLEEVLTIFENDKNKNKLYISSHFSKLQYNIWTSDEYDSRQVWVAEFDNGVVIQKIKNTEFYIRTRPVRSL